MFDPRRALGSVWRRTAALLTCLTFLSISAPAGAQQGPPAAPERQSTAILPELPEVPSSKFERPDEDAMNELKELLSRVRSEDPVIRERAIREVLEAKPNWVSAIYNRINKIADDSDRVAMKEKLRKIRDKARDAVRQEMRRRGETGKVVTPDYLQMVAEYAAPEDEAWQALISVLSMSRMLVAVGSIEAGRALIQIYVRFGEFLRVDTQLALEQMGDKAVPALVEASKHPAAKIGRWANRQLDLMGKAIASEVVQTEDQQVLADALRSYGRIKDPDAARIIISFANSERAQIRLAARQGVRLLGEVGNWQLRDTYQNIVGKTPPRDWSWKRTARELFFEFDRLRLAEVHQLFEKGLEAQKKGDWNAMHQAFDAVLAHNPMFDGREQMVDGYVSFAEQQDAANLDKAIVAVRRAERINADPKRQARLESLRLTLEGEKALAAKIADRSLFSRAIELDPSNQRAREGARALELGESERRPEYSRYYGAGAITGVGLLAILLILLWRPGRENKSDRLALEAAPAAGNQAQEASATTASPATSGDGASSRDAAIIAASAASNQGDTAQPSDSAPRDAAIATPATLSHGDAKPTASPDDDAQLEPAAAPASEVPAASSAPSPNSSDELAGASDNPDGPAQGAAAGQPMRPPEASDESVAGVSAMTPATASTAAKPRQTSEALTSSSAQHSEPVAALESENPPANAHAASDAAPVVTRKPAPDDSNETQDV